VRLAGLAGIAALSVIATLTGVARADDTKIALRIFGCEAANIKSDRLFELVRTELAPRTLMAGDIGLVMPELSANVHLCVGTVNTASITVQRSGLTVAERVLDLADVVGDLRVRTLAVALAEMVASLPVDTSNSNARSIESRTSIPDSKPAIAPTTPATYRDGTAPEPPSGAKASDSSHEQSSKALQLGAGAALRHFFGPSTSLLGPWVSISAHRISGEVLFLTSNSQVSAGSVALYNFDVAASYEFIAWGALPKFSARLKGELGETWAKGSPASPSSAQGRTQSSTQAAVLLEVLLASPMSRRLGIEARLSGGAASGLTASADKIATATTNGFFVGTTLGLTFDFSEI
jgi:hypothetical protein